MSEEEQIKVLRKAIVDEILRHGEPPEYSDAHSQILRLQAALDKCDGRSEIKEK